MKDKIKNILLEMINFTLIVLMYMGLLVILWLHKLVPFFPILFLFYLFVFVLHPLFIKHICKKSWHVCASDKMYRIMYILIPWIIFEVAVIMYYPKESIMAAKQIGAEERIDK